MLRHISMALIAVCLSLVLLSGIACGGEMTQEKCWEEAGALDRKAEELRNSELSPERLQDELRKLDEQWEELDEKCSALFP